jgi:membrane-associated phospholipid phosphatase
MHRSLVRPLLLAVAKLALVAAGIGSVAPAQARTAAPPVVDPVIQWNRTLLEILRTPGAQPRTVHPTRSLAILHLAIDGAVEVAGHARAPFPPVSAPAAADSAAHDSLVGLYPALKGMLDERLQASLAQVPDGPAKRQGVTVGAVVARGVLALRADDGSDAAPPALPPGTTPGRWRPTPPDFTPAVFTHWSHVRPFTLARADQFRPGPPPALGSAAYAAAVNEVQRLGKDDSTARTADQTQVARFWAAPIQNYWNEIAQTAALANHTTLAQNARLFDQLNLAFADATIAFYDAKYRYLVWRPVTAIRLADTDGNPATRADPAWTPLSGTTAPDPSYPGGHSTISTAGATVLAAFFHSDRVGFTVRSEALPGVERSFPSFSAAATEAGLSRIYAGQHTRTDHDAGVELGRRVARHVLGQD